MVRNYTYSPFLSDFLKKKNDNETSLTPMIFEKNPVAPTVGNKKALPNLPGGKKKSQKHSCPRDPITETENGFMEPKYYAFRR